MTKQLYVLKDSKTVPDPFYSYDNEYENMPIIIDNGSYQCRIGWESDSTPRLIYKNCYAKHRKDRGKKNTNVETELLVANDITNIETVRFQLKSPYDENVVTHFEGQELMFDYGFSHLGINTESVNHPIVITEAFCNPQFSRRAMSELLFECYGVPQVSYCIDSLLSFYHNYPEAKDGIIIGIGNNTTHLIPILNGDVQFNKSRRIRLGGQNLVKYMWRWMQLRFPHHLNAITISRTEELLYNHIHVAEDYSSAIRKWEEESYYESHGQKVQLPFIAQPVPVFTVEQQKERKREAAKRLVEMNARKRGEKLEEDQQELSRLIELEEAMGEFSPSEGEYLHALEEAQVSTIAQLRKKIAQLQQRVQRNTQKMKNSATQKEEDEEPKCKKMLYEFDTSENEGDIETWLEGIKQQWKDIHSRRNARKLKRQEMAKRRTLASQERMRIISQLAKREKKEDTFGMKDEDWNVYKAINKEGGGSDSEEDEERLHVLSAILRQHEPQFLGEDTNDKPLTQHEKHQITISTEQIRIGELLFQPSICGLDQGGISATLEYVLGSFEANEQLRLANNIFLTGSICALPGLKRRVEKDVAMIRPFQSEFNINLAKDPGLSAWLGAKSMCSELVSKGITKEEYEEKGGEYLKEHRAGNIYWCPVKDEAAMASNTQT